MLSIKRLAGDVFDEITSSGKKAFNTAMVPFDWETEHIAKPATKVLQRINKLALAPAEQIPLVGKKIKYAREHIQEPFGDIAGPMTLSPSNYVGAGEVGTALKLGSKIPKVGKYLSAAERFSSAAKNANTTRNVANVIKVTAEGKLMKGQAKRVPKFVVRVGNVARDKSGYVPDFYGTGVLKRLGPENINELGAAGWYTDSSVYNTIRGEGEGAIRTFAKIKSPEKLKILDMSTRDGKAEWAQIKRLSIEKLGKESHVSGQTLTDMAQSRGWDGVLNGGVKSDYNKGEFLLFNERHMDVVKEGWVNSKDFGDVDKFLRTGEVSLLDRHDYASVGKKMALGVRKGGGKEQVNKLKQLKELLLAGDTEMGADEIKQAISFIDNKIAHIEGRNVPR